MSDTPEHERIASDLEAEAEASRQLTEAEVAEAQANYLSTHHPAFHAGIKRHGIPLFHVCYLHAVASGALDAEQRAVQLAISTMAQAPSKRPIAEQVSRESSRSLRTLQGVFTEVFNGLCVMHGFEQEQIEACQKDIILAGQLAGSADRGLILTH